MKRYTADLGLLLVGILWGLGFVFVKIGLNEGISPFYLLTIRFLGGFLILYTVFRKRFTELTREDLKAGIIIGTIIALCFLWYIKNYTLAFITSIP